MHMDKMAKKMLIDATHAEETRVVVVEGNKVEEFDFESLNKKQLAGNIYLAKVTRVEPSLQAAFVDYGGNRHGFLAFSEIHPDYYQIPIEDRKLLIEEERAYAQQIQEESEKRELELENELTTEEHSQDINEFTDQDEEKALDTEITLEGKLKAVCDRFGTLKKGDDYESSFAEGQTTIRFLNPMVTGTDVLAVLKE